MIDVSARALALSQDTYAKPNTYIFSKPFKPTTRLIDTG